ncbi:Phospholipase/lecithinase/hemolysin [Oryzisolibacter propanilivorax]|uniref:Phospholipase/lecithinase/hemolysin n=1 Tax=Oryzisolibacter propanilivorax TaxID=1527607 RepID=A0A1G9Q7B8_9BURK|nr:SGNH/GDSL hydrolase family protein [Oryzisolibacter propanilivorax]SDM06265.1 Phospholipase/lecithinase/hemolysin [Oryzisolibacter propanilivorax]
MAANWLRRTFVAAACASAALLAACGSSSTESALTPDRLIAFGDGFADVGQTGSRYTINDGSANVWTLQVAERYERPLQSASAGGLGYAQGNARVQATPDAAGQAATPTVTAQIDQFLAGHAFAANDLVMLSAGVSDIIAGMAAVRAGTQTPDQYVAGARQAGEALAAQVRRLVGAGAQHILLTGTYDLGRSPWAKAIGQQDLISRASSAFNQGLLVSIEDLGKSVLYIDAAYYVNVFEGSPASYGFDKSDTPVCTSVDPGPGIGIGAGEVNSALCTSATLLPGAKPERYVFADKVYLTPAAQRQFGDYAYDRLRTRW